MHVAVEQPTHLACRSEPLSLRQRNAIQMAFRWWADGGPPYMT